MAKLTTKFKSLKKTTKVDFATYLGVIAAFIVVTVLQNGGMLNRKTLGLLVPICCYMSMAVSLNLTVGILGELSLGHAGFMSVGAFSGVIVSQSLLTAVPNAPVRLAIAMVVGAIFAAIVGLLVGTPVLRSAMTLRACTSSSMFPAPRRSTISVSTPRATPSSRARRARPAPRPSRVLPRASSL